MNTFYDIPNIQLSDKHLTDPMLMALAWKRAHDYVRSLNWYADNFELDLSALCLQKKCKGWVRELRRSKGNIKLTELQLIPAPKSGEWIFCNQPYDDIIAESYCVTWKPKCERIDPDFLSCLLRSRYYQRAFRAITTGHSNRRRTQVGDFESLEICFPENIDTQKRLVSEIVGARSDLKESNHALKEAWREFDHVIDGRDYELPQVTADDSEDDE